MANQGADSGYNIAQNPGQALPGQPQMKRDNYSGNQPSNAHTQGHQNVLQDTGNSVMSMAQGAADIGKGAAQGAVSIAKGAALGAANVAQGAADVVKNTFGGNTTDNPSNLNHPMDTTNKNHPSNPKI